MMKLLSIVGARPQFVKVAPVHREASKRHTHLILHTGQHYDYQMSQVFFEELSIPAPDHYLGIGSGSHGQQTGRMLAAIEEVLIKERPDVVIVYGDTNSTLAGALAAVKLSIPVAHVEAGLRSYRHGMPEEINRVLTDHISDMLFCPSEVSATNLRKEGVEKGVHEVGDTMTQVLLEIDEKLTPDSLATLGLSPNEYVLATIHRQENADVRENMEEILGAMMEYEGTIVLPLHPRTRKNLAKWGFLSKLETSDNIMVMEPMNFMAFTALEKFAGKIMTDSGGVQKEAYFFNVPCITVRDETEWIETLDGGWNRLVGAHKDRILDGMRNERPSTERRIDFGDRDVAKRIVAIMEG